MTKKFFLLFKLQIFHMLQINAIFEVGLCGISIFWTKNVY